MKRSIGSRALVGAALALFLIVWLVPSAAGAEGGKRIPPRIIPRKRIPNTVTYRQAPAFTKRERKNRRLVRRARQGGRRLKPGGTAFEAEGR